MQALPATLTPPAPFPPVTQTLDRTLFVAPGVRRTTYDLQTSAGPIRVRVIEADLREPTLHAGVVLASDTLVSGGETVSSMARRTKAVAGVNADYFDIGATNQPLNLVVQDGALVRTPSQRAVLTVGRDGRVRFGSSSFSGSVTYGTASVPLTHIGQWPPEGGASFVTPAFGRLGVAPNVTEIALDPIGTPNPDGFSGTYRVRAGGPATPGTVDGPTLGFGPAATAIAPPPQPGDAVTIAGDTTPPLDSIAFAVGGGPLLVSNGAVASDPHAPAPDETDHRFPVSGAATLADGSLLLVAVDGRQPALSIGLTRPEFAALMLGLGATDGMAFDSGGSAEIVWRELGDEDVSVANSPSDGQERRVADGLFLYSDAPPGPASRLVVRPSSIAALPGASVAVRAFAVDAAGDARGAVTLDGGDTIVASAAEGVRRRVVHAGALQTTLQIRTVAHVASLRIDPPRVVAEPGETLAFSAHGIDDRGDDVALGDRVKWTSDRGTIGANGSYRAASRNATVVLRAGGATASALVLVGRHEAPVAMFDDPRAWAFASAPKAVPGDAVVDAQSLRLDFDLSNSGRAAYANLASGIVLPGEPERFSIDVDGDASGAGLRIAVSNRFGERQALTLVPRVDWRGVRRITLEFPPDLNPPVTVLSLYAVRPLDGRPIAAPPHGTIVFRHPTVTLPGTP